MAFPNRDQGVSFNPTTGGLEYWDGTTTASVVPPIGSPSSVPNLVLWCSADQVTGLADGAAMASWTNQAPGGATVTQATGVDQPLFRLINGVPLVRNVAAGGFNIAWGGTGVAPAEATTFIVAANSANPASTQYLFKLGGLADQIKYSVVQVFSQMCLRQNGFNLTGFAVPSTFQIFAFAGSTTGASLPEGRGAWGFRNGDRVFRQQNSNAEIWDTSTVALQAQGYIGGIGDGQGSSFTGDLRCVLHYNRRLTDVEIQKVTLWLAATYGIAIGAAVPRNLVCDGDSLTIGYGGPSGWFDLLLGVLSPLPRTYNLGVSGQTLVQMASDAATQVDPTYDGTVAKNTLICWGGTNDMNSTPSNPTTAYNSLVSYCNARRTKGWKVIVLTCLPRGATSQFETDRQAFNLAVRAGWRNFADVLVDVAADGTIGIPGAQNNATYYQGDTIHLTTAGHQIVANLVQAGLASL